MRKKGCELKCGETTRALTNDGKERKTNPYTNIFICRIMLLLVVTTLMALASVTSMSLEDLEFSYWKLKFGEKSMHLIKLKNLSVSHFPNKMFIWI